jgi:hypothetical protein
MDDVSDLMLTDEARDTTDDERGVAVGRGLRDEFELPSSGWMEELGRPRVMSFPLVGEESLEAIYLVLFGL